MGAFFSSYMGKNVDNMDISTPFIKIPLPNWRLNYNGFSKIKGVDKIKRPDGTKKNYESLLADIAMAVWDYKEIHNSYSNVVKETERESDSLSTEDGDSSFDPDNTGPTGADNIQNRELDPEGDSSKIGSTGTDNINLYNEIHI